MNKYNTKPGQVLSLVNRSEFRSHVKATQSDKYCKWFSAWQQPVTMIYARLANPNGLRSLEDSLNCTGNCLYHRGIHKDVKRSTISYANNNRTSEVFEKLFYSELAFWFYFGQILIQVIIKISLCSITKLIIQFDAVLLAEMSRKAWQSYVLYYNSRHERCDFVYNKDSKSGSSGRSSVYNDLYTPASNGIIYGWSPHGFS